MTEEKWHGIVRTIAVTRGQYSKTKNTDYITKRRIKFTIMLQQLM